jgi:hypothetical protein
MLTYIQAADHLLLMFIFSSARCLSSDLDRLLDTIRLARVDLLAGLCDLLEHGIVGKGSDNLGGLVLKGHIVALDACGRGYC